VSTTSRARAAVERIDRALTHLPRCIEHVEDEAEDLAAQHFDPTSRSNVSSVLVCKEHGVDLADCQRDDLPCVIAIPVAIHSDPTGEAAVATSRARNVLSELDRRILALDNLSRWFDDFVHDHSPRTPRKANPVESKKAEQENAKAGPLCAVCVKSGKAIEVAGAITVDGSPLLACTFHKGFHERHSRLPNQEEEATHQRGKRVTARVSQMDRLRGALTSGKL
jgi:hypothetical protein